MQITSKFTIGIHLLAVLEYLSSTEKVTSAVLAGSLGVNPVIVRNVMGDLKESGLIHISQGKSGITLARKPEEITLYDVYTAVERIHSKGLFHFHDNPNPDCPIGKNIHNALDGRLDKIQRCMENEMKAITVADVMADIRKELESEVP